MKYTLKVIFGKEQVAKAYKNEYFTEYELKNHIKIYDFDSISERKAFIKGINETLGWSECCLPEFELNEDTSIGIVKNNQI